MTEPRFRPQLAVLMVVVAPLLDVSACAFSDLTGYEIASCDPSVADLDHDVCNRLNAGLSPDECSVWQCDAATSRCARRAKDFDRDGDPAAACGGHDCDDRSRTVVSASKEVCDGVDNDCDGLVDEDVFGASGAPADLFKVEQASPTSDPSISGPVGGEALAAGDATRTWVGAYVGAASPSGSCLKTSPLVAKDPPAGCAFGDETTLQPREPLVRNFGVGQGAVFVATNLCPAGALQYRYAAPGQPVGSAGVACKQSPAAQGAALPNVEFFKDGSLAVVSFYDEPLPDLASSSACQVIAAAPAPLNVIAVVSPTDKPAIQLVDGLPLVLSGAAKSRARPALARIDVDAPNEGGILVGSPDGAGASLWLVSKTADGIGFRLAASAATSIPGMNDARSVSLGASKKGTETTLAVVSDIGCSAQSIRVSFGTLAMQNGVLTPLMTPAVDVAAGGTGGRFSPVVRWVTTEKDSSWIVAWIESGGQVMARRYAAGGTAIGESFHLASGASVIDLAEVGRLFFFAPAGGANSSAFQSVPLGCLPN